MLLVIREARRLGKPVLVDIDDWLLDMPATHPEASIFRTRRVQDTMHVALNAATAITVSTSYLAERCAAMGLRAHVLPNAVDCDQFTRKAHNDTTLTVAFCGTSSHREDIPLIALPLRQLLDEREGQVRVVSVGCPVPELEGHAGYRHYSSVLATEYPRLLSDLRVDVGLAPLLDTDFNRAKSDIKYLEYSATGAATIASPVGSYQYSLRVDRGILVDANTSGAWFFAIEKLIGDTALRHRIATNAYTWVHCERAIEVTARKWLSVFDHYVKQRSMSTPLYLQSAQSGYFDHRLADIVLRQLPYDAREVRQRSQHALRSRTSGR